MPVILKILFFPPLLLILSCSSLSKKANLGDNDEQNFWIQSYIKANGSDDCRTFGGLSKEPRFVLQNLALIKARTLCPGDKTLGEVPSDLNSKFPYLKNINEDRLLIEAQHSKDFGAIAQAWRAKGISSDRVRDKLQFFKNAIENAEKNKDSPKVIEEIQDRIFSLSPRLKPKPKSNEYYKVGSDFIYNREFEKGRSYYKKVFESNDRSLEEQYQARRAYRNSFKTQQNRDQYIVESKNMVHWLGVVKMDLKTWHESYLSWARALWTVGRTNEAKQVLTEAEKKFSGRYPLDEIEFVRGRMSEEIGEFRQAFERYEAAEKAARDGSAFKDRLLFSKAWTLRKLGRYEEAAAILETLKKLARDPFDQHRYQFWWARSLKQAGRGDAALEQFRQLRDADTLGYYGVMAYHELNESLPPLESSDGAVTGSATSIASPLDDETTLIIRGLSLAQETEILEKYLNFKTQELRALGSKNSDIWLSYLKAYAQSGLYLPLFTQLGSLDSDLKARLLKENPELLFPRKFEEIINPSAEKFGVKPEMMLAIIRQESAFNPQARSPADAFGLMQLLPSVAAEQEGLTGVKLQHYEDLYLPKVNIPIGAALLAQLSKKYRHQFLLTVAAYNANEKAIENWLRTRLKEDPLEFIEDIPYEETRGYVKLILRNFVFYSRLNQPQKSLAFPAWCLEDLQSFKLTRRR